MERRNKLSALFLINDWSCCFTCCIWLGSASQETAFLLQITLADARPQTVKVTEIGRGALCGLKIRGSGSSV